MSGGDYDSLTPVVPGAVPASFGRDMRDSAVLRFASAAARSAKLTGLTSADEGRASWLKDVDAFDIYNGADWVPVGSRRMGSANWTSQTTTTTSEVIVTGSSVTWTAITGRRYRLTCSTMYQSSVAGDNVQLVLRYQAGASVTTSGTSTRVLVVSEPVANYVIPLSFVHELTGVSAGQTTAGLSLVRFNGSGTVAIGNGVSSSNSLLVEDMGT